MGIKVFFNNSCSICRMEINHYKKISNSNYKIPTKLKSGVYFAHLKFEDKIEIQKLVKY